MRLPIIFCLILFNLLPFAVDGKKDVILIRKPKTTTRPTKPSNTHIDCSYENGRLSFTSNFELASMNVSLSDSEGYYTEFEIVFEYNYAQIDILIDNGEYSITCETNNYGTFEGYITITN